MTVALPAGWHSWVPATVYPTYPDPLTRVVAVSAPFTLAPTNCQVGAYAFPATAVAIVVLEWVPMKGLPRPSSFRARPASFDAKALAVHPGPAIECFKGPGGATNFEERGRAFGAYLMVGPKASATAVARARAVLDSLRVS